MTPPDGRAVAGLDLEPREPEAAPEPTLTPEPPAGPRLGVVGTARWAWRQLTSMRVALLLLLLLTIAAVPGSVLPQRGAAPGAVSQWIRDAPTVGPLLDRLGFFDVYASSWFAAIYLLLFVSLVGCVLPRARQHWRAVRARPPAAPRRLDRLPAAGRAEVDEPAAAVLERAHAALRSRHYRVVRDPAPAGAGRRAGGSLAGERGHWRETGNLLFHLSLVVVLVAIAAGSLFGYRADVLLVEGRGFANSVIQFDRLDAGAAFDPADLTPFSLTLDDFRMAFQRTGPNRGAPDAFVADVTVRDEPGAPSRRETIAVNDPLDVEGTLVHTLNPGYAATITVRDAAGRVVFDDAVPFLPQDADFSSSGVVKVPSPGQDQDLALEGLLLPTQAIDAERGPHSIWPEPLDPALYLTAYRGDLGLDSGEAQSVFRLDKDGLVQLEQGGRPFAAAVALGRTVALPGGGSVTFDRLSTWVNLQVSRPVADGWALGGVAAAITGLTLSLFVRRRRMWVRVLEPDRGRTVVEVAGLDRSPGGDLRDEVAAVLEECTGRLPPDDGADLAAAAPADVERRGAR